MNAAQSRGGRETLVSYGRDYKRHLRLARAGSLKRGDQTWPNELAKSYRHNRTSEFSRPPQVSLSWDFLWSQTAGILHAALTHSVAAGAKIDQKKKENKNKDYFLIPFRVLLPVIIGSRNFVFDAISEIHRFLQPDLIKSINLTTGGRSRPDALAAS